uniref:Uncharacterized protein n=1 Tax=Solanum tuberosum TaxID=4113 RepID=M1DK34_SOLTU
MECVISTTDPVYEEIDIALDERPNRFGSVLQLFNGLKCVGYLGTIFSIGCDPWTDLVISVMKDLVWSGTVEVYHWFYTYNLTYETYRIATMNSYRSTTVLIFVSSSRSRFD